MKLLLFTSMVLAFAQPVMAQVSRADACLRVEITKLEMDLMSENIANINTTRTPEGGPYQPKRLACEEERCTVIAERKVRFDYNPDHADANEFGYVAAPAIDLMDEMNLIIDASRRWEVARSECDAIRE